MRNFEDTFETRKRSLFSVFSICMTVSLKKASYSFHSKSFRMRKERWFILSHPKFKVFDLLYKTQSFLKQNI